MRILLLATSFNALPRRDAPSVRATVDVRARVDHLSRPEPRPGTRRFEFPRRWRLPAGSVTSRNGLPAAKTAWTLREVAARKAGRRCVVVSNS